LELVKQILSETQLHKLSELELQAPHQVAD
jgi:hypothetical protein